ncbi:hypothetical protein U9M48_000379 [Paspalum notatum var. saurae]|uniref:DDE Tnp4 domain-containing protein n=1 Tax=Paspalum notatum var. saurae TaxID=547442 RepID=A0AAQ3PM98_PASNO
MSSSNKSTALEAQALMMTYLALAAMLATVAAAVVQPSLGASNTTTSLTLHNLCPYPVWPLVTANAGIPSMSTDADGDTFGRLDGHGNGLATLPFPSGAWSGRVVARTGCAADDYDDAPPYLCATGDAPPVTVAQVSVGGPGGAAAYSMGHSGLRPVVDVVARFTNIVTGWLGSMKESSILHSSGLFRLSDNGERLNGSKVKLSDGSEIVEYWVGDSGYPLLPCLLTPYQEKDLTESLLGHLPNSRTHGVIDLEETAMDEQRVSSSNHDENYRQQFCRVVNEAAIKGISLE